MTIFAFDGVFMLQNSHAIIFRYFVRNASIHDLNRFYSSIFAKLKLFFGNSGIRLLHVGRSLRFRSKSGISSYLTILMSCAKFQRAKRSRRWIFSEAISIFFVHLRAPEYKGATPFILSHIAYLYVWACVHSIYVNRSQKYQPHVELREIQKFIWKSRFSGRAEIWALIGKFSHTHHPCFKLRNYT